MDLRSKVTANTDSDLKLEMLSKFVRFLWNLANLFVKSLTFYLAINAAAIGYILSPNATQELRVVASIFGITTSVLYLVVIIAFISWGGHIISTGGEVNSVIRSSTYKSFQLPLQLKRARITLIIFSLATVAMVLMVTGVYIYFLSKK